MLRLTLAESVLVPTPWLTSDEFHATTLTHVLELVEAYFDECVRDAGGILKVVRGVEWEPRQAWGRPTPRMPTLEEVTDWYIARVVSQSSSTLEAARILRVNPSTVYRRGRQCLPKSKTRS